MSPRQNLAAALFMLGLLFLGAGAAGFYRGQVKMYAAREAAYELTRAEEEKHEVPRAEIVTIQDGKLAWILDCRSRDIECAQKAASCCPFGWQDVETRPFTWAIRCFPRPGDSKLVPTVPSSEPQAPSPKPSSGAP